jgi:predicted O-methyltransferase YrrM
MRIIKKILHKIEYLTIYNGLEDFENSSYFSKHKDEMLLRRKEFVKKNSEMYNNYINNISSAGMAMSLELASYLYAICFAVSPKISIDYGSGFSSFVIRYYKKALNLSIKVISVDDNHSWLLKTEGFLKENGVDSSNLEGFNVESFSKTTKIDLIFYDLNFVEERVKYLEEVINQLSSNGFIVFDDVHKRDYMVEVIRVLKKNRFKYYKINCDDKFGRFSIIAFK